MPGERKIASLIFLFEKKKKKTKKKKNFDYFGGGRVLMYEGGRN
jgi:hypothetical protein